jgi:hypothetical protein
MLLSKKQLNELNDILIEDYGKKLSQKQLYVVGTTLISYFELLAKIYQRNEDKSRCYEEHIKDRPKI